MVTKARAWSLVLLLAIFAGQLTFFHSSDIQSSGHLEACLVFDDNFAHQAGTTPVGTGMKTELTKMMAPISTQYVIDDSLNFPSLLSALNFLFSPDIRLTQFPQETFRPPIFA